MAEQKSNGEQGKPEPEPPYDLDAEERILVTLMAGFDFGVISRDQSFDLLRRVRSKLVQADFYSRAYGNIFKSICELADRNEGFGTSDVYSAMRSEDHKDSFPPELILKFTYEVPAQLAIDRFVDLVKSLSKRRALMELGAKMRAESLTTNMDLSGVVDFAEVYGRRLQDICGKAQQETVVRIADDLIQFVNGSPAPSSGLGTGFSDLDDVLKGLMGGNLYIVAARPGMGKSAFLTGIAESLAAPKTGAAGKAVVIFSQEMTRVEVNARLLSSRTSIPSSDIIARRFNDPARQSAIVAAVGDLSKVPIFVDETPGLTVGEMSRRTRWLQSDLNTGRFPDLAGVDVGAIMVDYLQISHPSEPKRTDEEKVSDISVSLKRMAKELSVPVISAAQLNRSCEARQDKRPMLSDLRSCFSGSAEIYDPTTGCRSRIDGLLDKPIKVLALNQSTLKLEVANAEVFLGPRKRVAVLETRLGATIRASLDHPVLTMDGWKQLGELSEGEAIAAPRCLLAESSDQMPSGLARFMGYMLSNGSFTRGCSATLAMPDRDIADDAIGLVKEFFPGVVPSERKTDVKCIYMLFTTRTQSGPFSNPLLNWLREIGCHGHDAHSKRIPDSFKKCSNDVMAHLLGGMYCGDGSVSRNGECWILKYSTVSEGLARDVVDALLRFGILADVDRTESTISVRVTTRHGIIRAAEKLKIPGRKGKLLAEAAQELAAREGNELVDRIPGNTERRVNALRVALGISHSELGYRCQGKAIGRGHLSMVTEHMRRTAVDPGHVRELDAFDRLATSDVVWDRVAAIRVGDEEQTYDVEVPKHHCLVIDGIVCHNSGQIEQDADVVMFLYRQEYYTPKEIGCHGQAEVIIAKNRNGASGITVELAFDAEFTRFSNNSRANLEIFDRSLDGYSHDKQPNKFQVQVSYRPDIDD